MKRVSSLTVGFGLAAAGAISILGVGIQLHAAQTPRSRSSPAPAANLSSELIFAELRARGLNLSAETAPNALRKAYTQYDFEANGVGLTANQTELWDATKNLSISLSQTSLQSHIRVRTQKPGARVWYCLVGRDVPIPSNQLTNKTEDDMPIGLYYIWAERDGKVTSDKKIIFRIIQQELVVDVVEVRQ